jgi:hypothetical protein
MEVDYATPTRLYESIQSSDWTSASRAIRLYPDEASTWVVRRDDGDVLWRFLPLHSALARNPPSSFIEALIDANPDALAEKDVSGMLPIHYAAGNRCSSEIMEMLLQNSASVWEVDGNGMTPLHYIGAYGCEGKRTVEMMLDAATEHGDVKELIGMKDSGGMTPLKLAREGEYVGKESVVSVMEEWMNEQSEKERDNRASLQVLTAQSPRHSVPRSAKSSPRKTTSRGKTRFSPAEISSYEAKEKNFQHVISPRNNGSQSGEYPIHLMDSRSPFDSPGVRITTSTDTDTRNDALAQRSYTITTRSLESPRHATTPHSTTPIASNSNVCNMKTPRSSGRGGRFGFDPPPPSPRFQQSITSPRGSLLSPRAQPPAQQQQHLDVQTELQRLQRENESLRQQLQLNRHPDMRMLEMQNETLMIQSQQKDVENDKLRAQLAEYQHGSTYNMVEIDATRARLQAILAQLQQRETSLTSIIQLAEQRENARLQSYTVRKQELLKLLAVEENERQNESGYVYEGMTIGGAFGRELRALEEIRADVCRMLEGLNFG